MKNKTEKKVSEGLDKVMNEVVKIGDRLKSLAKQAKDTFDKADDTTKKKVVAGLAGATAVLAAIVSIRGRKRKSKK